MIGLKIMFFGAAIGLAFAAGPAVGIAVVFYIIFKHMDKEY